MGCNTHNYVFILLWMSPLYLYKKRVVLHGARHVVYSMFDEQHLHTENPSGLTDAANRNNRHL